jgi:hypothetical protein
VRWAWLAGLIVALLAVGCGSEDDKPAGPTGPLTADELYHACIRTAACGVKTQPRLKNCVDYYHTLLVNLGLRPIYDDIFRCANKAADCHDLFECFGSHPAAGSCDQTFKASCDGDRAVTCDLLDRRVYVYDCSLALLRCEVKQGSSGFEASCTVGDCDMLSYKKRCDGDRVLACYQGVVVVEDCAIQNMTCLVDPKLGGATCAGKQSEACDAQRYQPSCDGSVALTCQGGRVRRHDCGLQMVDRSCSGGSCVSSGSACTDEFNRCQGGALQACLDGSWRTFDCAALGLGSCKTEVHGAVCGKPTG